MTKYMIERPMEKVGEIHCNWGAFNSTSAFNL